MMNELPQPGRLYTVPYPFIREDWFDWELGREVETWRPGIRHIPVDMDGSAPVADETGTMTLTVVDCFKPGRFPTRVFYTRTFTDPDGKTFGNGRLHIATLEKFRRLAKGYQYPYGIGKPLPRGAEIDFMAELRAAAKVK